MALKCQQKNGNEVCIKSIKIDKIYDITWTSGCSEFIDILELSKCSSESNKTLYTESQVDVQLAISKLWLSIKGWFQVT